MSGADVDSSNSCLSWKSGDKSWTNFATLDPRRFGHSAVSFQDRVLLLGGDESPFTGVELPSGREFFLPYAVGRDACLIPQTDGFIVTGGTSGVWDYVEKYSSTGEFVENLPYLVIGRRAHACGTFEDGDGRAVLLVTGGISSGNKEVLSSTEMLWPDSDGLWTSWTAG